jgi:DNA repair protein REV1
LDKKSIVYVPSLKSIHFADNDMNRTHIITSGLTAAKMTEFQHMKVVRPEWLPQSAAAGRLLPWTDFIFVQGDRPESSTQDAAPPQTSVFPRYAADESNPNARRAMANPEWRTAHTAAAPGFIKNYFEHSRLHFMSAIKAELVREAQARAEAKAEKEQLDTVGKVVPDSPVKGKGRADQERVIMHCDFDSFFVAAGLLSRPHLRGRPVVVCHSQGTQGGGSSTSEIACASYEARASGVKNGMRCTACLACSTRN